MKSTVLGSVEDSAEGTHSVVGIRVLLLQTPQVLSGKLWQPLTEHSHEVLTRVYERRKGLS